MAKISRHLLSAELTLWNAIYEDYENEMQPFGEYMNKKYMFNDKDLEFMEDSNTAYEHIIKKHVKKV